MVLYLALDSVADIMFLASGTEMISFFTYEGNYHRQEKASAEKLSSVHTSLTQSQMIKSLHMTLKYIKWATQHLNLT